MKRLDRLAEYVLVYEGLALAVKITTGKTPLPPVSRLVWAAERRSRYGYLLSGGILLYLTVHFVGGEAAREVRSA